jgi:3-oxoacyl-[acyl-carrier-protein] synthase II
MQREAATGAGRLVAVSGIGAVCGLGWGVGPLWEGLRAGRVSIGDFHRFDHSQHRTHLAAEADAPPTGFAHAVAGWRRLSIADRFALFAAREAVERAGLVFAVGEGLVPSRAGASPAPTTAPETVGVFFGSSTGGMYESEAFFDDFLRDRRGRISQQVNGPGDAVARHLGATGPVETFSSACASGALALGVALRAIRSGEVEIAVAGGADSLCQLTYAGFNALRSVDEVPCRPFRAGRAGMSFGEGAAVLVLEPLERALARGAEPLAVLAGAGASCDAHHMTAPDSTGAGAAAALAAALDDAGLPPEAIDFVNVHGTGTPLNDAAEWQALRRIFGRRAAEIPLVATKALVGHLLGSSGALEAVATILCLRHGELHPVPAEAGPGTDPELPVALVSGDPLPLPGARAAVSTSLAFGGSNAALVFSRWMDPAA